MAVLSGCDIETIFFDVGGTLRARIPDESMQCQTRHKFMALLGKTGDPGAFFDELCPRYKAYSQWARENLVELPEKEIWTRWMLPEFPREKIEPIAKELMVLWRNRSGRAVLKPDAPSTIVELRRRGYRMGVISNTNSSAELPLYLADYELKKHFEVIVLSAVSGCRKPDPEIFWEATRAMRIESARCAYVGNQIPFDVVGSRRAGFATAIIIEPLGKPHENEPDQMEKPNAIIHELRELLRIFPLRKQFSLGTNG